MKIENIPFQHQAKRVAEVALSGGHSILFIGKKDAYALNVWVNLHDGNAMSIWPCHCGNLGSLIECTCTDEQIKERGAEIKDMCQFNFDMVVTVVDETEHRRKIWKQLEHHEIERVVSNRIGVNRYKKGQFIGGIITDGLLKTYKKSKFCRSNVDIYKLAETIAKISSDGIFHPAHLAEAIQYQPAFDFVE